MEKIFIKAAYSRPFAISENLKFQLAKIPDKIGLVSTVQFSNFLPIMKKQLEDLGREVHISGGGTFLGCNAINAENIFDKVDAFLYVGSGKFHPLQMALKLKDKKRIFLLHPEAEKISELNWKEVEDFKKKREIINARALSSDELGLLVSIKPGQCNLSEALKFKENFEKQGKKAYLFLFDNFDETQIENWNKLTYVNTACPGLALDKKFVNLRDLK
jgi:2-(3-amino-3-carboxypropyl)histidine synthase